MYKNCSMPHLLQTIAMLGTLGSGMMMSKVYVTKYYMLKERDYLAKLRLRLTSITIGHFHKQVIN